MSLLKQCFVPSCNNTSANAPDKIFLCVPSAPARRREWIRAVKAQYASGNNLVCCEDHFNLERDARNWLFYQTMGHRVYLKEDVVPHRNLSLKVGDKSKMLPPQMPSYVKRQKRARLERLGFSKMDKLRSKASRAASDPKTAEGEDMEYVASARDNTSRNPDIAEAVYVEPVTMLNVEIRMIDVVKGRGLFAKTPFKKGSIIFQENPLISCQFSWNATCGFKACNQCLRPLETAQESARRLTGKPDLELPFSDCCTTDKSKFTVCGFCGVEYCSLDCQVVAFQEYHRVLCPHTSDRDSNHPLKKLNDAWQNIHYPPETNTIMLIVRLLARIVQSPLQDSAIQQTLDFCHRTVSDDSKLSHKLLGKKFAGQLTTLLGLLEETLPHNGIEQFLTPVGFEAMLALIGTNAQTVGTSAIHEWVMKTKKLFIFKEEREELDAFIQTLYEDMRSHSGNVLNNEGVALYALQSTCNHSCDPNAESTYCHNNHKLTLVAAKDIKAGEEICISYLDDCSLNRSKLFRRKQLMEYYLFICDCTKCQEETAEPDVTSIKVETDA